MKNPKRLLTWILVAILVVSAITLTACVDKPEPQQLTELTLPELKDNQMAVIIKNGDNDYTSYVVTLGNGGTEATTADGVLNYLAQLDILAVDMSDGWLSDIGNLNPDANAHEYVAIYTSVQSDWSEGAGATAYTVGNVKIAYSGYGISQMKVETGALLYFEIQTW